MKSSCINIGKSTQSYLTKNYCLPAIIHSTRTRRLRNIYRVTKQPLQNIYRVQCPRTNIKGQPVAKILPNIKGKAIVSLKVLFSSIILNKRSFLLYPTFGRGDDHTPTPSSVRHCCQQAGKLANASRTNKFLIGLIFRLPSVTLDTNIQMDLIG